MSGDLMLEYVKACGTDRSVIERAQRTCSSTRAPRATLITIAPRLSRFKAWASRMWFVSFSERQVQRDDIGGEQEII
jgi:hypothetical protein